MTIEERAARAGVTVEQAREVYAFEAELGGVIPLLDDDIDPQLGHRLLGPRHHERLGLDTGVHDLADGDEGPATVSLHPPST